MSKPTDPPDAIEALNAELQRVKLLPSWQQPASVPMLLAMLQTAMASIQFRLGVLEGRADG